MRKAEGNIAHISYNGERNKKKKIQNKVGSVEFVGFFVVFFFAERFSRFKYLHEKSVPCIRLFRFVFFISSSEGFPNSYHNIFSFLILYEFSILFLVNCLITLLNLDEVAFQEFTGIRRPAPFVYSLFTFGNLNLSILGPEN